MRNKQDKSPPGIEGRKNEMECASCGRLFSRLEDRDRHVNDVHAKYAERSWKCSVDSCPASVKSWVAHTGLRKHNKKWHGPYICTTEGCSRGAPHGFSTAMELQEHVDEEHPSPSVGVDHASAARVERGESRRDHDGGDTEAENGKGRERSPLPVSREGLAQAKLSSSRHPERRTNSVWGDEHQHYWSEQERATGCISLLRTSPTQ